MAFIDYYKLLEIDKTATGDDIKKAYRKLARKYHPDMNPNDKDAQTRFQQINEANEVLSDPEKRKKYDAYGENWQHAEQFEQARQQQSRGGRAEQQYTGSFDDDQFSDFFESLFGQRTGNRRRGEVKFRGQDYSAELQLSLRDAYETHQHTLTVNGKNIRITVPAGIADGQVIKLKGYGGPGVNNGPAGDLYITFSITEDPEFKRVESNLYLTKELDLYTAILGGELLIETLSGKVKLTVPAETQNGTKVKLKGKGFPVYKKDGEYGDLIVTYNIKIPTGLSAEQKELFKKIANLNTSH